MTRYDEVIRQHFDDEVPDYDEIIIYTFIFDGEGCIFCGQSHLTKVCPYS